MVAVQPLVRGGFTAGGAASILRGMATLSAEEMVGLWQQHTMAEFVHKDVEAALSTMTEDAHVLCVAAGTGGFGKEGVRKFYGEFIPAVPPDFMPLPISQTVGGSRLVEEAIYRFTHSIAMDWMLPGVPATHKPVELALVGIIEFRDGKIASEHLYWDQATLLAQLGIVPAMPAIGSLEAHRRMRELVESRS